jgi:CrcB protein
MHGPDRPRAHPRVLAGKGRRVLRDRWDVLLVISAGGALGSLARWGAGELVPHRPDQMPWATAGVNVVGCALIGVLMVLVLEVWPPSRYARPFLGTGVLGGFTTFSTYMLDTRALLVAGRPAVAAGYLFGSLLAGLAGVWAGTAAARLAVGRGAAGRAPRSAHPGSAP